MWIERLEIAGFGRLRGDFELARGATLITGPNEAGKSTLHQALMRALFGFDSSDRRRTGGESVLQRWCPWDGPPYGVAAVIHCDGLDGGRALRATWRFDRDDSSQELRLIDERTGEDLTARVAAGRGDFELGRHLLDLDHPEFCQVCMLEQAAIGAVERSDDLVTALRRATEMGASEVGVERATELLNSALGDPGIGVRRDNLTPLRNGALAGAQARLADVSEALDAAERTRSELAELARRHDDARTRIEDLARRREIAEQRRLVARAASLASRVASAERSQEQASYEPDESAMVPGELGERARDAFRELDRLAAEREGLAPRADAARDRLRELEAQAAELESDVRRLAAYESVDAAADEEVHALLVRIEEREPEREREPAEAPAAAAANGARTEGRRRAALAIAGAIALASLIAGALVSPLALLGLIAAAAVAYLGARRAVPPALPPPPAAPPRERRPGREALEAEITRLLDAAGAPPAPEPIERARSYREACRRHRERADLAARHASLRAEAREAGEPVRRLRELTEAAEAIRSALRELLAAPELRIDAADLDAARREFDDRMRAAREARARAERAERAREALDTALGGASVAELRAQRDEADARLREHRAMHGELVPAPRDDEAAAREEASAQEEVEALAAELGEAEVEAAPLKGLIEDRERELAQVPALREERAVLEGRIERIAEAAEAIAIARDALDDAAAQSHRRFAPVLNEAIGRDLPRITGGRYQHARVSEELAITLDAPETGAPVPAEVLSRGTQDQIYLVERLAILGMLDTGEEVPPLLLDDVFVHFDSERLGFALELIAREARNRQVLLFADDARIADGLERRGIEHRVVSLEPVGVP